MALAGFISKIVQSITRTTFQFNKTLDVLIDRFKGGCPTTKELESLVQQKNQINGALNQINQKIATLNKVAQGSEVAVEALKAGKTVIKQLPIPSSVPPGVGLPLSVTNNLADSLDNLGTLIDKEEASLESIPEALELISNDVGEVITKLNEFDVVLNDCIEKDPNITSDNLNATTFELEGILSEAELENILNTPPGLLYGDYYLRLSFPPTDTSLIKKQIIAQNKESVVDGEFYNENAQVEELLGDESFSSSNVVLVDEMKWLIDTKDLIFPPPEPQEDPLKAIYRENQIIILMSLFGANREEASELYELAWELSQNRGPTALTYYDQLVQEAFDNSRTILEQAVANEGYEWQQGDRILDATIKRLFLADYDGTDQALEAQISSIRRTAENILEKAKEEGGDYDPTSKRWSNDGAFGYSNDGRLYPYSERLALTAENLFNDATIGNDFVSLRPEMAKRKPFFQAIFEAANLRFLSGAGNSFNDPLKDYFLSKNQGYNQPIINEIPISGNANELITSDEIRDIWQSEINIATDYYYNNLIPPNLNETSNGLTYNQINAYSKTQILKKLKNVLGINWYNANAQAASELPFWSPGGGNPNSSSYNQNNVNAGLTTADKWYFEFGRNDLPVPTGS
jgi:uncharacterized protein YoxC